MKTDSVIIAPGKLKGKIDVPSSKSDGQRAVLAAALSSGKSILHHVGNSSDELNMLRIVEQFGAKIVFTEDRTIEIKGKDRPAFTGDYHIGESGLGLRLLTTVFSTNAKDLTISGEGTLQARPMDWFDRTLPEFGLSFTSTEGFLPFKLNGEMVSADVTIDGSQSSQFISGLLMALPMVKGTSRLQVLDLNSVPYVRMTLNTLKAFGIAIEQQNFEHFIIPGDQKYLPADYTIEGDWSSASYWLVASALGADLSVRGLSMSSMQADKKILDAFVNAGCSVIHTSDGLMIKGEKRHAFEFDATHCPDLFPALVTFASLTSGETKIHGLKRLKHKESDRGVVLKSEFAKLGIRIELIEDTMLIHGNNQFNGSIVSSHGDHRIAMCLAIAGKFASSSVTIYHPECVSKSYADFWDHLDFLSGNL
jgi:3-phosphoshikimate 1-carboxyvinyltransferase